MGITTGPLETEQDALALPAVQAIYAAMRAPGAHVMAERGHQLLDGACEAAGVELGAYEHKIIGWLAGFGPKECAVFAGLITRAHDAGLREQVGGRP